MKTFRHTRSHMLSTESRWKRIVGALCRGSPILAHTSSKTCPMLIDRSLIFGSAIVGYNDLNEERIMAGVTIAGRLAPPSPAPAPICTALGQLVDSVGFHTQFALLPMKWSSIWKTF